MGIFSWLFHTRDSPKNSTPGAQYRFWTGQSASGKSVTEFSAMQMTAVYACVRILSEAIASLPLHVYRQDGSHREKATDMRLYWLLHDEPNPDMTSFVFRETLMTHLLLWGNAYAQIIRNTTGDVLGLYPLMPNRMKVDRDDHGVLYYEYTMLSDDGAGLKEGTVRLEQSDVLHIPGLGFDGIVGYSPIAMAKNAIGLAMSAEEFGSKFFANGATPGGVIEHPGPLSDQAVANLRESWNSRFTGTNAHKVAILEEGMKYTQISVNPNEAQFLETRKFQLDEIARIFRVPPHMIGDLDRSTFSNIENMSREFVTYTLNPWLARWEQALNKSLLRPQDKHKCFCRFNVDGLLRGDYKSRIDSYAIAINNGFMCPNDVRELEDLDRIPDDQNGDQFMVNGNMVPLKDVGAAYLKNVSGGETDDGTTDNYLSNPFSYSTHGEDNMI